MMAMAASNDAARLAPMVKLFQKIGAPLMVAVTEVRAYGEGAAHSPDGDAEMLSQLVAATAAVSKAAAAELGAAKGADAVWARWAIAAAAARLVAAHYRATGAPLPVEEGARIASAIQTTQVLMNGPTGPLGNGLPARLAESTGPEQGPVALQVNLLYALAPVVGAVARFAFSYTEQALVADIAKRLQASAAETAAALAPGASPSELSALYQAVLEACGQLYAECHYGEMDRLLDMSAEERAAYADDNGGQIPLTPVWQAFDLRLDLLKTIAANLQAPAGLSIDPPPGTL